MNFLLLANAAVNPVTSVISLAVGFFGMGLFLFVLSYKQLYMVCRPNEVLIFSGGSRRVGDRRIGYRVVKDGSTWRKPFLEKVDRLDLTNMIIELNAVGAYAKGGVPLNVQGVANVKVAGHEPVLNNAIERFLGKGQGEIMAICKATLEGSLRGVLATLTPEQINADRNTFAERLVEEVEQDLTALGLVVDTLKIQNTTDDVRYLDSIGRIRNSELIASARSAEAIAQADSKVRSAENRFKEVESQIRAETLVAKAEADRRLNDAMTRRAALVAEEQAKVVAMVAQAEAEIKVQQARVEQVRRQLEADVLAPARAECEASESRASAEVAKIIEDGRARAEAIKTLAQTWKATGDNAREIMVLQKLENIITELTNAIAPTKVERLTVIDTGSSGSSASGVDLKKLMMLNEQVKEIFGIDLANKIQQIGGPGAIRGAVETSVTTTPVTTAAPAATPFNPPNDEDILPMPKATRSRPVPPPVAD